MLRTIPAVPGVSTVLGAAPGLFSCAPLSSPSPTSGQPRPLELREVVLEVSWVCQGAPGQRGDPSSCSVGFIARELLQHHSPWFAQAGMGTPECSSVSQAVPVGLGSSRSVWGQPSALLSRSSLFILSYFISVQLYGLHEILWFTALPIWSITTAYDNLCTSLPLRTFLIVKIVLKNQC